MLAMDESRTEAATDGETTPEAERTVPVEGPATYLATLGEQHFRERASLIRFFDRNASRHDPPGVDGEAEVQTPSTPQFYESYPNADGAEQFFERHPEARPAHAPLPVVREEIKTEEPEAPAPTTPNPSSPTEVAPEEVMEVVTESVALMTIRGELDGAVAPLTEATKLALAEPRPEKDAKILSVRNRLGVAREVGKFERAACLASICQRTCSAPLKCARAEAYINHLAGLENDTFGA